MDAGGSEDEAGEAFAPLLRDVAATTDLRLSIEHATSDDGAPVLKVSTVRGGGAAWIWLHDCEDSHECMALAADAVQELMIEELWRHGRSNWPVCPAHPTTHPMEVGWTNETPCWRCPVDPSIIVAIGSL